MDETIGSRALVVGVSVFMAIITVGMIMVYYNSAKEAASSIGNQSTTVAEGYRRDIEETLLSKSSITGTDLINLLNYFKGNNIVTINVKNLKFFNDNKAAATCTGDTCTVNERINVNNSNEAFEDTLKKIIPTQEFSIVVQEASNGSKNITVTGK